MGGDHCSWKKKGSELYRREKFIFDQFSHEAKSMPRGDRSQDTYNVNDLGTRIM